MWNELGERMLLKNIYGHQKNRLKSACSEINNYEKEHMFVDSRGG